MNKALKTDFLCPTSSFVNGAGSILALNGQVYRYNTSDNPDEVAIASDWIMIGQEIRKAIHRFDQRGVLLSR